MAAAARAHADRSRHRLSRPAAVRLRRRRPGARLRRRRAARQPGGDLPAAGERALGVRHAGDAAAARSRARRAGAALRARLERASTTSHRARRRRARRRCASAGCEPDDITLQLRRRHALLRPAERSDHLVRRRPARASTIAAWLREAFEDDYEKLYGLRLARGRRRGRELAR